MLLCGWAGIETGLAALGSHRVMFWAGVQCQHFEPMRAWHHRSRTALARSPPSRSAFVRHAPQ
eukprot:1449366-Prymnesium_polylepis.1